VGWDQFVIPVRDILVPLCQLTDRDFMLMVAVLSCLGWLLGPPDVQTQRILQGLVVKNVLLHITNQNVGNEAIWLSAQAGD